MRWTRGFQPRWLDRVPRAMSSLLLKTKASPFFRLVSRGVLEVLGTGVGWEMTYGSDTDQRPGEEGSVVLAVQGAGDDDVDEGEENAQDVKDQGD